MLMKRCISIIQQWLYHMPFKFLQKRKMWNATRMKRQVIHRSSIRSV